MTRDRREVDIEALLQEAGARWRSLQPAPAEPSWQEVSRHRFAYLAAAGVAAAAVLTAMALVALLSLPTTQVGEETTVPGGQDSPSPEDQSSVVHEGDVVTASGQVLLRPDAGGPVLCRLGPVLLPYVPDYSPSCSPVQVALGGLDPTTLPGWRQVGTDVWLSSDVRVTGTWRSGKLEVSNVVSSKAPSDLPEPSVVPCRAPDTGWPGNGDIDAMEAATERLDAEVQGHPDLYNGMWWGWIGAASTGPLDAAVVGTVADLAAVRSKLEEIYPFNLCVVQVPFSRSQLDGAAEQISGLNGSWQVRVDQPFEKVLVQLVLVDEEAAKHLEPYGDKVQLDPLVERAD